MTITFTIEYSYLGNLRMEFCHVLAQHLTKFAENFFMPGVILQVHFGLNLHNEDNDTFILYLSISVTQNPTFILILHFLIHSHSFIFIFAYVKGKWLKNPAISMFLTFKICFTIWLGTKLTNQRYYSIACLEMFTFP